MNCVWKVVDNFNVLSHMIIMFLSETATVKQKLLRCVLEKKCDPNTIYFVYTLDINISVTSPRPLESDELNRSVPSLVSSLVIDSDVSPISVGILSKGAKSKFSYFYSKSVSVQHLFNA